ncbi:MAG: hypothetical protein FWH06_04630 [Oscillospiraceae bacterium]|nr:hypothetical protein [Oscillospiraceae bacterium]
MRKITYIKRTLSLLLIMAMAPSMLPAFAPTARAASAAALVTQIEGITGLSASLYSLNSNVVEVTGTASAVSSTVSLNIDPNVTVNWGATLIGSTASGKYLLNLTGGGTFNVTAVATISNGSGIITVTGAGANVNIDGALNTPGAGNGISLNVAAKDVTVNVGGSILNEGTNSAVNVTAGVTGVRVNVGGSVVSVPAGYAINDGGTALCANNTQITVTGGRVEAGSACAIKSVG